MRCFARPSFFTTCLAVTKMDKQDALRLRTSMGKSSKTISCHILPFIIPEPVSGFRTDYWLPRVLTLNLKLQLFSTISIGINLYIGYQCIVVPGRLGNPPRNIPSPFGGFYFRIRQKETPLIPPTAFSPTSPKKRHSLSIVGIFQHVYISTWRIIPGLGSVVNNHG